MKRIFIPVFYIAVIVFLTSCSASRDSIYKSDYPLTSEIAKSHSTKLSVRVPEGWIRVDDNKNVGIDLWLVREDFAASIVFTPIHIDSITISEIKQDNISDLHAALNYSKTIRRAVYGDSYSQIIEDEYFSINGRPFAAYQFKSNDKSAARVIIFRYLNYFFEVSAEFKDGENRTIDNFNILFSTQNAVVSSLK